MFKKYNIPILLLSAVLLKLNSYLGSFTKEQCDDAAPMQESYVLDTFHEYILVAEQISVILLICFAAHILILQIAEYKMNRFRQFQGGEQVSDPIAALHNAFIQLSNEDKQQLFNKGLVIRQSNGKFSLKYISPISKRLMQEPVAIPVRASDGTTTQDICDYPEMLNTLLNKSGTIISPVSQRQVVTNGKTFLFFQHQKDEHTKYMQDLREAQLQLKAKNAF